MGERKGKTEIAEGLGNLIQPEEVFLKHFKFSYLSASLASKLSKLF
jgi:hypothetical protein